MKTALTIAGSDSSGGAGIQADLKTMLAHGVYGMSVLTALTAQNTLGVSGVLEVEPDFVEMQLRAVFEDIPPDAVKIGMVFSAPCGERIAAVLREYGARNIVVDPVMVATSGSSLTDGSTEKMLKEALLPLAAVATPNIPEAEALSGRKIRTREDMLAAAEMISRETGCAVLCKGGHLTGDADDLLYQPDGAYRWFRGERVQNPNTHGTGCTLSSAIAANLALGLELPQAVEAAKAYVTGALGAMLDLGQGSGPLDHGFWLQRKTREE